MTTKKNAGGARREARIKGFIDAGYKCFGKHDGSHKCDACNVENACIDEPPESTPRAERGVTLELMAMTEKGAAKCAKCGRYAEGRYHYVGDFYCSKCRINFDRED